MKDKKVLAGLIVVFVLLLGGAGVLYNRLSASVEHDGLAVETAASEESETQKEEIQKEEIQKKDTQDTADGIDAVNDENSTGSADSADDAPALEVPDFTVVDQDGNEVRLSDFIGQPVILNFWASWCGPCQSEMPDFDEAHAEYGDQIHFVMVNLTDGARETVETAKAFIEEKGYGFPVYFDTESSAAMAYRVYSIPATYFIDGEGKPVAQGRGALDGETLQKGIDMLLD